MTNKICEVCGEKGFCRYKGKGKLLCEKHYNQMYWYGKILKRIKTDKNEIINKGNYYEMVLYNRKSKEVARTIFSKNQLEKIKNHKWCLDKCGYVITTYNKRIFFLHHFIFSRKKGYMTDHKDRNPLNNLNENLRFATRSQNAMNRNDIKGIYWDKKGNKWIARLRLNKKYIYLGYFADKSDAIKARQKGELKYFGEFAPCLNPPKFPQ